MDPFCREVIGFTIALDIIQISFVGSNGSGNYGEVITPPAEAVRDKISQKPESGYSQFSGRGMVVGG